MYCNSYTSSCWIPKGGWKTCSCFLLLGFVGQFLTWILATAWAFLYISRSPYAIKQWVRSIFRTLLNSLKTPDSKIGLKTRTKRRPHILRHWIKNSRVKNTWRLLMTDTFTDMEWKSGPQSEPLDLSKHRNRNSKHRTAEHSFVFSAVNREFCGLQLLPHLILIWLVY